MDSQNDGFYLATVETTSFRGVKHKGIGRARDIDRALMFAWRQIADDQVKISLLDTGT